MTLAKANSGKRDLDRASLTHLQQIEKSKVPSDSEEHGSCLFSSLFDLCGGAVESMRMRTNHAGDSRTARA